MEGVTLFDQVTPIASPQFGSPPLVLSPTQEGGEARFKRAREENGFDSDCMEFSGASAKKVMSTVGGNDDFNQLTTPMIIGDSGSDAFNLVPPAIPSTVSERIMVDKTSVSELQKRVAELEALQARLERERQLDMDLAQMKIAMLEEQLSSSAELESHFSTSTSVQGPGLASFEKENQAAEGSLKNRIVAMTEKVRASNALILSTLRPRTSASEPASGPTSQRKIMPTFKTPK